MVFMKKFDQLLLVRRFLFRFVLVLSLPHQSLGLPKAGFSFPLLDRPGKTSWKNLTIFVLIINYLSLLGASDVA